MEPQNDQPNGANQSNGALSNPAAPQQPINTKRGYGAVALGALIGAITSGIINFLLSFIYVFGSAGKLFLSCGDACSTTATNQAISAVQLLAVTIGDLTLIGCVTLGVYNALKTTHHTLAKETAVLTMIFMGGIFLAGLALLLLAHSLVLYSSSYLIIFASAIMSRYLVLRKEAAQKVSAL